MGGRCVKLIGEENDFSSCVFCAGLEGLRMSVF